MALGAAAVVYLSLGWVTTALRSLGVFF